MSSGRLQRIGIPDLFRGLRSIRGTGRLRVDAPSQQQTADVRIIYFDQGHPVFAKTNVLSERLGEVLVAGGLIEQKALVEALKQTSVRRRLGVVLVELAYLTPKDLVLGLRQQVQRIVSALFTLEEGSAHFEAGPLARKDIVPLHFERDELLRQGIEQMSNPRLLMRSLGSMEGVLELNGHANAARTVASERPEKHLVALLRSKRMTVRELCRRSSLTAMQTCRFLTLLVALGYVTKILPD